ncbi:lipoprotein [Mycoplasma capricolum subsp. capricolum]|uniref:lipoprotein n=1 Tax=Mycoplasma capricolum TaxID=2095 RepID=UPI003DA606AF
MKKLLTLLGSVALITTTSAAVIACGGTRSEQKVAEDKKDDKTEKTKEEEKEEFKSVLSDEVKKEASELVKTILVESLDLDDDNGNEVNKNKEDISKEFASLLDEILFENKKDIEKSLKDFNEELVKFTAPFILGDTLEIHPELKIDKDGSLNKSVWTFETEINNKKEDIIGIVFNKDLKEDLIEESNKIGNDSEDEEMIKDIVKEYKEYLTEYKRLFEEENKENLGKLKELIQKHFSKTTEIK